MLESALISAVLEVISNPFTSACVQRNYHAMLSTAKDSHSCNKMRSSKKDRTANVLRRFVSYMALI